MRAVGSRIGRFRCPRQSARPTECLQGPGDGVRSLVTLAARSTGGVVLSGDCALTYPSTDLGEGPRQG